MSALEKAVPLAAEEVDCLICALAGTFPERYQTVRMDLLRKLAKEKRAFATVEGA